MDQIRGDERLLDCLSLLLQSQREELLLGFGHRALIGGRLLLIDDCRLADDDEVRRDLHGLHWSGVLTSALYAEARRSGRGVLFVHAHPGHGRLPRFSETDQATADEILSHFGRLLPQVPHAYAVVNSSYAAGWMQFGNDRRSIDDVRIVSCPLRRWPSDQPAELALPDRDKRQIGALGAVGVRRLRSSSIGIIGLGGAGSQAVEMLGHAGIGRLILADADVVKDINLSRTHGTSPSLVGVAKVEAAQQMVARISPETEIVTSTQAFPTPALLTALRDVDVLISCVDNVHTRSEVNRFVLRYAIPLLDVGTTITEEPVRVDGHLSLILPGGHCLRCLGHVSDALLEEEQDQVRRGNYGVSDGRPQVVSFNGLLASAAVTEVLKLLTGFAGALKGSREWHYDAVKGEMRLVQLIPQTCQDCQWFALKGDDILGTASRSVQA